MDSFEHIIAQWGTVESFAQASGVSLSTAKAWKRRNSVPAKYWSQLIAAAAEKGLTLTTDELVALAAPVQEETS